MNLPASILLAGYGLFLAATGAVPAPSASPPLSKYQQAHLEAMKTSAPADAYFGRMKMSYLGINNTLRDAAISSGDHTTNQDIITKVGFAEDALTDWERHYPRDPQLARTYFLAIQSEKRIWLRPNQERAWTYMNRIVSVFPATYFGKIVKRDLSVGFTEHYYANPVPCPTPTPEPTQTPEPTPSPTPSPAPRRGRVVRATPTPVPTAMPTPEPTPTPAPTPLPSPQITTLAKNHKVQVEIPPCVAPATPTPTPSPSPSPTLPPVPVPSASPVTPAPLTSGAPLTPPPLTPPPLTPPPSISPPVPAASASPSPSPAHRPNGSSGW